MDCGSDVDGMMGFVFSGVRGGDPKSLGKMSLGSGLPARYCTMVGVIERVVVVIDRKEFTDLEKDEEKADL